MRKSLIVNMSLAAALSLGSTSGLAANISLAPLDGDPAHAIVVVEGRLESGDEIQFRTQVGRLTKAIVAFDSDGGNLLAGIAIGKTIRLKSFATAVLDEQRCVSACALAWLGGTPRFMGRTAHVGFHAAYIEEAGRASESGVGNALVGSYLTQIGLSETAVVYITQAAPTELTLLTLPDAEKIGMEVLPFEEQTPATKPAPPVTSREASNEEISGRARLFVKEINSRFSRTNVAEWLGAARFASLTLEVPTDAAPITKLPLSPGVIEVEFKTGVRLRICGPVDAPIVASVVQALSAVGNADDPGSQEF